LASAVEFLTLARLAAHTYTFPQVVVIGQDPAASLSVGGPRKARRFGACAEQLTARLPRSFPREGTVVKKTSIFGRIKGRWKSPSGISLDSSRVTSTSAGGTAAGPANRVSPGAVAESTPPDRATPNGLRPDPAAVAKPVADRLNGRKLSAKEEAIVAVEAGFKDLAQQVRGVQSRMDSQNERAQVLAGEMAAHLRALPELGRAQLDVLLRMSTQIDRQNATGEKLAASLGDLPEVLRNVRAALDRTTATEERTAATLGQFRSTMDRIEGSMEKMVANSKTQSDATARLAQASQAEQSRLVEAVRDGREHDVRELVTAITESRAKDVNQLTQTTTRSLDAVRKIQDEHSARLGKLVADGAKWGNVIVVLLTLTFFAIAGILALIVLQP